MNVSRSGRIRKKSKFLTDSEFHTPKDSVIYGLSSATKNSSSHNESKKPSEGEDQELTLNESKDKNKQPMRHSTAKANKSQMKRKRVQKVSKKQKDFSDDDESNILHAKKSSNINQQKYFIVVEETSSKGTTENLIFLVEENPAHTYHESRKSIKRSYKRSKLELNEEYTYKSSISPDFNASKDINEAGNAKPVSGYKSGCDINRLPLQVNN